MKFRRLALMGLGLVAVAAMAVAADEKEAPKAGSDQLQSVKQKVSYGIGLSFGKRLKAQLKSQGLDLDEGIIAQGIQDGFGDKSKLTDQQIQEAMQTFEKEVVAQKTKEGEAMAKKGEDFLAGNKKKPGVVTLPSGLQYKVLKDGAGKSPKGADMVTANYEGRLIDGTVFDSSEKHGGPATFQVGRLIKGWNEALPMMKVGSKWQLYIPADLAYGANPPGPPIPPNAPLIFDLELLDTKPAPATPPAGLP